MLQAFELVSDEAKKDIKKQIEEVQAELKNSLSEVNRNVNEVRAEISNVLNEIRKEQNARIFQNLIFWWNLGTFGEIWNVQGIILALFKIIVAMFLEYS